MPLELQTKLSVLQFLGQLSARGSVQVREGSCYTCDSCTQGSAPNHCLNKDTAGQVSIRRLLQKHFTRRLPAMGCSRKLGPDEFSRISRNLNVHDEMIA